MQSFRHRCHKTTTKIARYRIPDTKGKVLSSSLSLLLTGILSAVKGFEHHTD